MKQSVARTQLIHSEADLAGALGYDAGDSKLHGEPDQRIPDWMYNRIDPAGSVIDDDNTDEVLVRTVFGGAYHYRVDLDYPPRPLCRSGC